MLSTTTTTDRRTERLAELVAELTGCPVPVAAAAVHDADRPDADEDDRLEVVARALVTIRRQGR